MPVYKDEQGQYRLTPGSAPPKKKKKDRLPPIRSASRAQTVPSTTPKGRTVAETIVAQAQGTSAATPEPVPGLYGDTKATVRGQIGTEQGKIDQAQAMGIEPQWTDPEEKNNEPGTVDRIFDVLSRPNFAVGGAFQYLFQDNPDQEGNLAEAVWNGISGQDKTTFTGLYGEKRAETEAAQHDPESGFPSTSNMLVWGLDKLKNDGVDRLDKQLAEMQKQREQLTAEVNQWDSTRNPAEKVVGAVERDGNAAVANNIERAETQLRTLRDDVQKRIDAGTPEDVAIDEALKASPQLNAEDVNDPNNMFSLYGPVGNAGVGLLTDVTLDPTTYMGFGLGKQGGKLLKGTDEAASVLEAGADVAKADDALSLPQRISAAYQGAKTEGSARGFANTFLDSLEQSKAVGTAKVADNVIEPGADALRKVTNTETLLQEGQKGAKARSAVIREGERNFKQSHVARGLDTSSEAFKAEQKAAGIRYADAQTGLAKARVAQSLDKLEAIAKTDPVAKLQVKVLGKPVIESAHLGAPFAAAEKAFKNTKAGQLLRSGFVAGAEVNNPEIHNMTRLWANVSAGQYEESLKELQRVFSGRSITRNVDGLPAKVTLGKTSKADRIAITQAIESGNPKNLPPKLVPHYDYAKKILKDIGDDEIAAGLLAAEDITDNYIYHVYQNKKAISKYGKNAPKGKKFGSIAEARAAGAKPVEDIADILAHRIAKSHRQINNSNFLKQAGELFGVKTSAKTRKGKALKAMVEQGRLVEGSSIRGSKGFLNGRYFDPEIAQSLTKAMTTFAEEPTTHQFFKLFDRVQAKFKFVMTAPNPGFHIRNLMGDVFMNYLDGVVDLRAYTRATKALKGSDSVILKLGDETLTGADVLRLYESRGLKSGYFHAETGVADTQLSGRMTQAIRSGSEAREDWTRMAHFVDSLKKEYDDIGNIDKALDASAARVKRFNFDYQDLTHFEKTVMKRIIPFYTYMRKNVPLQLEMLFTRPGRVAILPKGGRALTEAVNPGWRDDPLPGATGVVPQWIRDDYSIGLTSETRNSDAVYWNPDLPFVQAADMLGGFTEGPAKGIEQFNEQMVSGLTPLAKIPLEYASGTDPATGIPSNRNLSEILMKNVPVSRAGAPLVNDDFNEQPTYTVSINGQEVEVPESMLNWVTGAGMRKVTPKRQLAELLSRRDELDKAIREEEQKRKKEALG